MIHVSLREVVKATCFRCVAVIVLVLRTVAAEPSPCEQSAYINQGIMCNF